MRLDLPGVDPKDVEVSVVDDTLVIRGERKTAQELKEKEYQYRETAYGRFERRLGLPKGVDRDKVSASYKNGVLEVSIPLPAQLANKTIPIQIEEGQSRKLAAAGLTSNTAGRRPIGGLLPARFRTCAEHRVLSIIYLYQPLFGKEGTGEICQNRQTIIRY